ncbi:MAG: competence/damage-inducible protein A [Bacteroidetes bacterium]|nr:MAG: competence/damage-inducible protein A [Bacteroidota bacterium]
MTAEIITIGDELLIGQVINSNQAFIAERFNTVGIVTERMTTVGDSDVPVREAFAAAFARHDVVAVTGGLGPTHDDITKRLVCEFFGTDLVTDEGTLAHIKELAQRRNLPLIQSNLDQALVPRSCTVIPNRNGTAPGMLFERDGRYFAVMPGVPFEMKAMVDDWLLPFFAGRSDGLIVRHRTLKTTGIGESMLAKRIGDVSEFLGTDGSATLAFLPNPMGTKLRITVKHRDAAFVDASLARIESALRARAERYIYASDEQELEHVVGRLLNEQRRTLALAESCTGGFIAHRVTNVPGSSAYFLRGFVTYSDRAKTEDLGVPAELIARHGAVSAETAEAMAAGARRRSGADIALSCTGIAGPGGGSPEKPVGLCYIGFADAARTFALKFSFGDHRLRFKDRASQAALELLRRSLLRFDTLDG